MNRKDIEREAMKLERLAIDDQTDAVAQELHSLSPADRRAVARKIEKDAKRDSSGFLPEMVFTAGGDLKSVVEVDRVWLDNHKVVERKDYNPTTGKLRSWDLKGSDGSTMHEDFDATTGRRKSYDEKNADGSTEHWEADPTTGNLIFKDMKDIDGFLHHIEYDAIGRLASYDIKDKNGNTTYHEENRYDPTTGNQISEDVTYQDGTTKHTEYDAATGNEKSK